MEQIIDVVQNTLGSFVPTGTLYALPVVLGSGGNIAAIDSLGGQRIIGPSYSLVSSNDTPITISGNTTAIGSPASTSALRIHYLMASNSSSTGVDVSWRDGTGSRFYRATLPQNATYAHNLKPGYWQLTAGSPLTISTSTTGSVHWTVEYETVAS